MILILNLNLKSFKYIVLFSSRSCWCKCCCFWISKKLCYIIGL